MGGTGSARRPGPAGGFDPVRLTVFHELFAGVAEEMGELLQGTAPSVNIRERRDFSCALFDADGRLVAQAAHIPVHLGSAGLSVEAVRARFPSMGRGDVFLLNDPYAGGTHLPDLTLVGPAFPKQRGRPWFLVVRAHHSDVGGSRPGSMAPAADLPAEGLRIPPVALLRGGEPVQEVWDLVEANTRTPAQREGDLRAQIEALRLGERRLGELWRRRGLVECRRAVVALHDYSRRILAGHLAELDWGRFHAEAVLEGDGVTDADLILRLDLEVGADGGLVFDFSRTDDQGPGCLNANPAITLAAVLYCLRCLIPGEVPTNAGLLDSVRLVTRPGSLCQPRFPAAVAGGNVETSQRLVDLCFAALGKAGAEVPAESAGTMNNLSVGGYDPARGESFAFYETLGGGAGASAEGPGASAIQTHMTNTRNTPIEECELGMPLVVERLALRQGSGGSGARPGGEGLVKELGTTVPLAISLLADRRRNGAAGRAGGGAGLPGRQVVVDDGQQRCMPAKGGWVLEPGQVLRIETPGGGGHGRPPARRG